MAATTTQADASFGGCENAAWYVSGWVGGGGGGGGGGIMNCTSHELSSTHGTNCDGYERMVVLAWYVFLRDRASLARSSSPFFRASSALRYHSSWSDTGQGILQGAQRVYLGDCGCAVSCTRITCIGEKGTDRSVLCLCVFVLQLLLGRDDLEKAACYFKWPFR